MSRLSPTHYGEYTSIYRLMTGKEQHALYEKCSGSVVSAVDDESVTISCPKEERREPLGLLTVCIGRETEVGDIFDGKLDIEEYESLSDPSLSAVGAVAGDHFVRYLVGGCLHVARQILKK